MVVNFTSIMKYDTKSIQKCTFLLIPSLVLYVIIFCMMMAPKTQRPVTWKAELPYVVVHIDLKGAPPKMSYLKTLLPLLQRFEANALLMEYEDTFPFEGELFNLSATYSYKKTALTQFLNAAADMGLEIIPLVQTFGHMEYVLKLEEFTHLRESKNSIDSICPSKKESKAFIKKVLEQVIQFHNNVTPLKHILIGGDEVLHMNECPMCQKRQLAKMNIYLEHIVTVSNIVTSLSPYTKVLIWDDMLRHNNPGQIQKFHSFNFSNIEPVYWDYRTNLNVSHTALYTYHKVFKNIWAASAFKGADGYSEVIPNAYNRYINNLQWINLIANYRFGGEKGRNNFKGIILTGWSRYNHMADICELLPVSIPSLILNLITINKYKEGFSNSSASSSYVGFYYAYVQRRFSVGIDCNSPLGLDFFFESNNCTFDGSKLLTALRKYENLIGELLMRISNDFNWITGLEYHMESKSIDILKTTEFRDWLLNISKLIKGLEKEIFTAMAPYYNSPTIDEYISSKTFGKKKILALLLSYLDDMLKIETWKRRIYHYKGFQ